MSNSMTKLAFTKVEAIGNDFVLIDAQSLPEMDWPEVTRRMCARHFGVGSDGLLLLLPSETADFRMRMFNPDGSEDMCGNGLRCLVHYIWTCRLTDKRQMAIETWDGIRRCQVTEQGGTEAVRVNMNRPSFRSEDIPAGVPVDEMIDYPLEVDGQVFRVTGVQVGSPHAVIFMPLDFIRDAHPPISPLIENHPVFPERVNVTWCCPESPESLRIRTWERGAGPTLGCGTGACAALVAANVNGLASERAKVISPGGTLDIAWPGQADVFMTGPAHIVFEGEWLVKQEGVME